MFPGELLDPLRGVFRVDDPDDYPYFVDPNIVHVSPIYKSDTSALNAINDGKNGRIPAVNAKGFRRGLMAFKILAVGVDPPGAVLPTMTIEIVDGTGIDLSQVSIGVPSEGGGPSRGFLVQ